MQTRRQRIIFTIFLFHYFFLRLLPAGYFKDFWDDEAVGLNETYIKTWQKLLMHGSMEASAAPLYHLINKLWHGAWGFFPHAYWDLRIFNRIPHIFYWCTASALTYFFLERLLRYYMKKHSLGNTFIAMATSLFLHSNTFAIAYSVEDRGYSLWMSLATVQLLVFFDGILMGFSRRKLFAIGLVSFLAAFGAFTSLALTTCITFYFLFEIFKKRNIPANIKALVFFIPAYMIGLWYFYCTPQMGYGKDYFVYSYFFDTIQHELAKIFHYKAEWPVWVSLPIFFVLPGYVFRNNILGNWIRIFAAWALFCAFLFFKGTNLKGGIWANRYLIFFVPYFTALYWLNLLSVLKIISEKIEKKFPKYSREKVLYSLIIAWGLLTFTTSMSRQIPNAIRDWKVVRENNFFRRYESFDCVQHPIYLGAAWYNLYNMRCRNFKTGFIHLDKVD